MAGRFGEPESETLPALMNRLKLPLAIRLGMDLLQRNAACVRPRR